MVNEGLRKEDVAELAALGLDPETALVDGYERCPWMTYAILIDEAPAAIFGVVPYTEVPGAAIVWMLGTDRLLNHKVSLVRDVRAWLDDMQQTYPYIFNWVSLDNTKAVNWLEVLGFEFDANDSFVSGDVCFRRFFRCATPP